MAKRDEKELELEEGKSLLGTASQKSVERMLKRAAERSAKQAQKRVESAAKRNPFKNLGHVTESAFAAALSKALKRHAASAKRGARPSIKMTAPDSGGRPFHFDHTAVSKTTIGLKPGETVAASNTYGKRKAEFAKPKSHTSTGGAHMAYIEREGAAEDFDLDRELDAAMGRGGRERAPGAMQEYLEDDLKVSANEEKKDAATAAPGRKLAFSFGTPEMGDTLEERMAFWDLAEKHAERGNATIQHRLIVELPHECSAEDRLSIMRDFTAKYEADRVPYWCVLHAPVEGKNDDRNFHAHIVLLNRPAWKELFPEGGKSFRHPDGPLVPTWTFAATEDVRDKHDNYLKRYPLRSNVLEGYRGKFVADERKRFAKIVNAQMEASKVAVRYDHRSYKAMGLEVEAMGSVKGMILKKAEAGERLVLDPGQTRRLVAHEIERLARERATDLGEVDRVKRAVRQGASRLTRLDQEARRLGRRAGLARNASMAVRKAYAHAAFRYALAKEAHVKREIQLRFDAENLRRHIEATQTDWIAPLRSKIEERLELARKDDEAAAARQAERLAKAGADPDKEPPRRRTQLIVQGIEKELDGIPDADILGMINQEARRELARVEKEHAKALSKSEGVVAKALRTWKSVGVTAPAEVPMPAYTEAAARPPTPNPALAEERPEKPKSHLRHYPESAHAMIDEMFNTPHARAALDMANRLSDHIQEAAKLRIKGKDTVQILKEEVKAIVDAFARSPAEGEILLSMGPRDRSAPAFPATKGTVEILREQQAARLAARAAAAREVGETAPSATPGPEKPAEPPRQEPQRPAKAEPPAPPAETAPAEDEKEAKKRRKRERERERRRAIVAARGREFDRG